MHWRSILLAVATTVGAVGCSSVPEVVEEAGTLRTFAAGDSLEVPRAGSGTCSIDYRTQIHRVDPHSGVVWSLDLPWVRPDSGTSARVVVHEGTVLATSSPLTGDRRSFAVAVDLATGEPRWQRTLAGSSSASGRPIGWRDLVVVGEGADLVALDLETGRERWRRPAVVNGTPDLIDIGLVHGLGDGSLVVVDPAAGEQIGELPIVAPDGWFRIHETEVGLLVETYDALALVDPTTTRVRWEQDLDAAGLRSEVLVLGDVVVLSVHEPAGEGDLLQLVALDLASGEDLWARGAAPAVLSTDGMPVLLVSGPGPHEVSVLEPATGEVLRVIDLGRPVGPGRHGTDHSVAQPSNDLVLVRLGFLRERHPAPDDAERTLTTARSVTVAFDPDEGSMRWSIDRHETDPAAAVVVDGLLLVGASRAVTSTVDLDPAGRLLVLDPADGSIRHEVDLRDPVTTAPIVVGESVVVLSSDPAVFCD